LNQQQDLARNTEFDDLPGPFIWQSLVLAKAKIGFSLQTLHENHCGIAIK